MNMREPRMEKRNNKAAASSHQHPSWASLLAKLSHAPEPKLESSKQSRILKCYMREIVKHAPASAAAFLPSSSKAFAIERRASLEPSSWASAGWKSEHACARKGKPKTRFHVAEVRLLEASALCAFHDPSPMCAEYSCQKRTPMNDSQPEEASAYYPCSSHQMQAIIHTHTEKQSLRKDTSQCLLAPLG